MSMTAEATLRQLQERLNQSVPLTELVEESQPETKADAIRWARHLSAFDEYRNRCPNRVIALARIIARRALKEYQLVLTEDGRVLERHRRQGVQSEMTDSFEIEIGGQEVRVDYIRDYYPADGTDLFQFRSPDDPARPIPLSETGYWSHFAHHDAVEACNGPQTYSQLVAAARLDGHLDTFEALFEGEARCSARRASKRPVLGEHTAKAADSPEPENPECRPPRSLF